MSNLEEADKPFAQPTFARRRASATENYDAEREEDDVPENMRRSQSKVEGMSAADLVMAHRHSLASVSGVREDDIHSVTLGRDQVEMDGVEHTALDGEDYEDRFQSFKFGTADDE